VKNVFFDEILLQTMDIPETLKVGK
jgi:hypothetical protein